VGCEALEPCIQADSRTNAAGSVLLTTSQVVVNPFSTSLLWFV
jgi:hypothetical protein